MPRPRLRTRRRLTINPRRRHSMTSMNRKCNRNCKIRINFRKLRKQNLRNLTRKIPSRNQKQEKRFWNWNPSWNWRAKNSNSKFQIFRGEIIILGRSEMIRTATGIAGSSWNKIRSIELAINTTSSLANRQRAHLVIYLRKAKTS